MLMAGPRPAWPLQCVTVILIVAAAATVSSCDEQSFEAYLADKGLVMTQRPSTNLRPGVIFGTTTPPRGSGPAVTRGRGGTDLPPDVPVADSGSAWTDFTPLFSVTPEFMTHYLFTSPSASELRQAGVERVTFCTGREQSARCRSLTRRHRYVR